MVRCPGGSSSSSGCQIDVLTGELSGSKCRLPSLEFSIRPKLSTSCALPANGNQSDVQSDGLNNRLDTGTADGSVSLIICYM